MGINVKTMQSTTNQRLRKKLNIVLFIFSIICGSIFNNSVMTYAANQNSSFWVEFVDVGQGDCAIIQCDGHYMMIDGGPSKASSTVYSILKNKNITNIDLMIATHPDEDHIGGLSGALNYAKVGTVLSPVTTHDSKTFKSFTKYIRKQDKVITVPKAGDTYTIGSANVSILAPLYNSPDTNDNSIVAKVSYAGHSFIFMGDAEEIEENSIVNEYIKIECDVLKVGHHGSNSSTSKSLLKAVKPKYAVISVGKNNDYGHPTQEILNKLTDAGCLIYRTDLQGDITFTIEKNNLKVATEKRASSYELSAGDGKNGSVSSFSGNDIVIPQGTAFVLNTNSKKFHLPNCDSVKDMSAKNMQFSNLTAGELQNKGYVPCKKCCSGVSVQKSVSQKDSDSITHNNSTQNNVTQNNVTQSGVTQSSVGVYVLNTNSHKFHIPTCSSVGDMSSKNRQDVNLSRDEILAQGYVPCKRCNP